MRRPVNPDLPKIFETLLNSSVALIQAGVEFNLQASDRGAISPAEYEAKKAELLGRL